MLEWRAMSFQNLRFSLPLLMLSFNFSMSARAASQPWIEEVRRYALQMVAEAAAAQSADQTLTMLYQRLEKVKIGVGDDPQVYGYAYPFPLFRRIELNPDLRRMPIELAAELLVHEGAHLLPGGSGAGIEPECFAENIALTVVRNSISSRGRAVFGYVRECKSLAPETCGLPILSELPQKVGEAQSVTSENVSSKIFLSERIKNWVGGSQNCTESVPNDFNEELQLTLQDQIEHRMKPQIILYLNRKIDPQLRP